MRTDTWYRIVVVDRVQAREVAAAAVVPAAKAAVIVAVVDGAAKAAGAATEAVTRPSASCRSVGAPAW
jgi:hypothetical protein